MAVEWKGPVASREIWGETGGGACLAGRSKLMDAFPDSGATFRVNIGR